MKCSLPISLKIAAGFASVACVSFLAFLILGPIFRFYGWSIDWWPSFVFEALTAVAWVSAFGGAVMTLFATWATRRYLRRIGLASVAGAKRMEQSCE